MLNEKELQTLKKLKISELRFVNESEALFDLGYNQDQIKKLIMRCSSEKTVSELISKTPILRAEPYELSLEEILNISAHNGGGKNLKAIKRYFIELETFGFNKTQILKMISHNGGWKNLETVKALFAELMSKGFDLEQIRSFINRTGGSVAFLKLSETRDVTYDLMAFVQDLGEEMSLGYAGQGFFSTPKTMMARMTLNV